MKEFLNILSSIIWSPALVALLLGAGIYFSVRTRFVQFRKLKRMVGLLKETDDNGKSGISSFHAFCLSLSGRVGTGNIVGVATAIAVGGPGAVFWMWIVAFLGASTAFVESTLSQLFRFKHDGMWRGGPAVYIKEGLHCKWLAVLFAVATLVGSGICSTTVQTNGMALALNNTFNVDLVWGGISMAVLVSIVIIGGSRFLVKVSGIVTPFMAIAYMAVALIVIAFNWRGVLPALGAIVTNAFGIKPLVAGIMGSTISMGVKRGLFSNEAGQGIGAIPSASAESEHPVDQGLVQALTVFVDTILVCTATALMILTTNSFNIVDPQNSTLLLSNAPELGNNYVGYTQAAVSTVFGNLGNAFVSIELVFFVFTTMMAYYFYAESSIMFLFKDSEKKKAEKLMMNLFKVLFLAAIIYGAVKESDYVWALADIGVGVMAWINVICILLLSPHVFRSLKDYESR